VPRRSRASDGSGASVALVTLLLLSGCKCGGDRPYTPFRIGETSATESASALPPPPSASGAISDGFPREAALAPKDTSRFTVDGVPIEVAPDRVIERALAADFDGDDAKDAVAWTYAKIETAETASTGELVFFGGKTPAGRVVSSMPPFVPSGPGCKHAVTLAQTGPKTVTLDVAAHCEAALVPRSPTRGLSVIAPAAPRPTVLALRFADPAPSEALTVAVDSRDRDEDGRDDVRVTVTLRTDPADAEASADLVWLDRAAGPSRDASEPAHSLGAIGSIESVRASGKTTSTKVPGRVANARRLAATLCAEGGTPRIFDADGAPFACSDLASAMQSLLGAEVRAHVARHDPLSAAAALGRDGWYGAPTPPKARAALEKDVASVTDRRTATEQAIDAIPRARSGFPRFSPLAFEPDGALLVQTAEGVSRIRFPEGHREDASEGVDPWPLTVAGTSEPRWTGIAFPCDRSEIVLLESDTAGTPLPSVPTRLLAPRPGPCRRGGVVPTPELVLVEWVSGRMVGLIGGGLFGTPSVAELAPVPPRGSPRSPDGKSFVVPWSKGLMITTGTKTATWSVTTTPLTDCVVANGGSAVACVHADRAIAFTPGAATETAATTGTTGKKTRKP
jgi:hypothetical protein